MENNKKNGIIRKKIFKKGMRLTMKNKKIFIIIISILLVLITFVIVRELIIKKTENNESTNTETIYTVTEDSKRFKEEYEALNGTKIKSGEETYNTVNIPEENPIVYVDINQFINIINSDEKSYVYMSSAKCPYCRASIETLLKVLKDLGVEKLYYLDLGAGIDFGGEEKKTELTNKLIVKGLVTKKPDGSDSWRIPLVAKTQSGQVLAQTIGTGITYNEGQSKYSELTEEQKQQLYNEYYELLKD